MAEKAAGFCMSCACGTIADKCLVVPTSHVTVELMTSVTHISSGSVSSLCTVAQGQLHNCTFVPVSAGGLLKSIFIWFQKK